MATLAEPIVHGKQVVSQLKTNTLNLFDATIIATSSVAPAYSLAATIAFMFVVVGVASPAAILVSFFPVMFIALAYYYLNRMDPNCGASYSWVSRTLSPYIGWFGGWVQLCANVLFCAAAPLVAGAYTLQLLNSFGWISADAASSAFWTAVAGVLWLLFVTYMVVKGIRLTANFQWVLLAIEYLIVVGFCVAAFVKVIGGHPAAQPVHLHWFNPLALGSWSGLASGAALGVFFFWGWDTAANVNEETKDAETTPGYAGLISMVVLLVLFLFAATAIDMVTTPANLNNIGNNGGDILYFFAQGLSGAPVTYLMVLAVLSSTVATMQTTLLPSSRLSFSMARDRVFPKMFGVVHKSWQTPWVGTLITTALSIVVIAGTFIGSVEQHLRPAGPPDRSARCLLLRDHRHCLHLGVPESAVLVGHALPAGGAAPVRRRRVSLLDRLPGGCQRRGRLDSDPDHVYLGNPVDDHCGNPQQVRLLPREDCLVHQEERAAHGLWAGGGTMELSGSGGSRRSGAPADPAAQTRSRNE